MAKRVAEIFWGWYVVLGAFLVLCLSYGVRYSFGVFVHPMFQESGWPMSVISLSASANILVYSISGIFWGRLADRIAPKWIMTAGSILTALGFYLLSRAQTPAGLYLSYGLLCGVGHASLGMVVCAAAIGKWFVRKRGLALGLSSMGIGVGTMVMGPAAGYIVSAYDWRAGFLVFGAVILALGMLISQVLMGKTTPEASGLRPDGDPGGRTEPGPEAAPGKRATPSLRPVLTDSRFWLLAVCNGAATAALMMVFVHGVAYAVGNRIGKLEAAAALGILGLASSGGKFFFGWLCDRVADAKYVAALGFLVMAIGMGLLTRADTAGILYLFAVIFGIGYGSMAPLMPYLTADRFGRRVLGSAYGMLIFFVAGVGGSIGPVIGGAVYDRTGSYANAWLLDLIMLLLISLLVLGLKPARAREA
ncbi:MAG: MFS transporter [Candidatus Methylomirabilales bacterium]